MQFLPYIAFFLSGASSLIFQSIWTRMLHHVFGSTSVAMSTVLSVFMAGLGLGAWLFGKYADRIKHPLITYAIAEAGVAICGLIVPLVVSPEGWLAGLNSWMRVTFGNGSTGFALARFVAVVPILLIPTTLMGSTLPLLSRHFIDQEQRSGAASSRVGILYALNTFGAVAGTFLSGFLLMPNVGLSATNFTAVCMNVFLGVSIFLFRKQLLGSAWKQGEPLQFWPAKDAVAATPVAPAQTAEDKSSDEPTVFVAPLARKFALLAFGASGAAALAYEVVWTRALAAGTIGSSIYSFTIILMTFLIGIAGGSAFVSSILRSAKQSLIGVGIIAALLTLIANASNAVIGNNPSFNDYIVGVVIGFALLGAIGIVAFMRVRASAGPFQKLADGELTGLSIAFLAVPVGTALTYCAMAHSYVERLTANSDRVVEGLAVPEILPMIVLAVVGSIALFLAAAVGLRRSHVVLLAVLQFFIGAATFVNYIVADDVPIAFANLVANLQHGGGQLADHEATVRFYMFFSSMLMTLPATLGMGAMFPLTMRVWSAGGAKIGQDVAVVYTSNTIGSIIGAWLPGFVLMPLIGMERTLHLGIAVNLVLALLMVVGSASDEKPPEGSSALPLPALQVGLVYGLACVIPLLAALAYLGTAKPDSRLRWDLSRMTLGVFRVSHVRDMLDPAEWGSPDIVFYKDGVSTTVTIERWGSHLALKNNGKVDASNGDDMPTQIMVAGYPLLLHPAGPTNLDVAVVGFGSGTSVGTALQFPVRSVRVIELERAIPEAARFFTDVNHLEYKLDHFPYIEMPRLEVVNDDGRNYLASTDQRFDVIVSEPSNPWITGVSDLFTSDHFRIAKSRLKPNGIYTQWVQLYEMSPENIKCIFRTFAEQFRYVVIFAADDFSSDTVVIGSDSPINLDMQHIRQVMNLPGIQAEMTRAKIDGPQDVLARILLASREEVMRYTEIEEHRQNGEWIPLPQSHNDGPCEGDCRRRPAPLNTDDNAHIEFAAPRDLIGFARYEGYLQTIYGTAWPYGRLDNVVQGAGQGLDAARNYAELAFALMGAGRRTDAASFIERADRSGRVPETPLAAGVLSYLVTNDHEPPVTLQSPIPGPQLDARSAERLIQGFDATKEAISQQRWEAALDAFEQIPAPLRANAGPAMRFLDGYLRYKSALQGVGRFEAATTVLEDLIRGNPDYAAAHPEVYYFLAKSHDQEFDFRDATLAMRQFVTRSFERQAQERIAAEQAAAAAAAAGTPPVGGRPNEP